MNKIKIDQNLVTAQLKQGNRLNIYKGLSGNLKYNFLPEPLKADPRILIIEEYQLSSFLGAYGAGRTIKTYSLLPGEKTKISIRTYKSTESTSKSASSILDSYTEESADEFEESVMNEQSSKENSSKSFEYHAEAEAKVGWGWGSASVSGGVAGSSDSSREDFAKNVSNATSKHAASSSAKRDIEINTSFEVSQKTEQETSIVREIQNINVGRTLNFTFRQMNQKFITLLHLTDVKIAFFNGYAESRDEASISKLDHILHKYIVPDKIENTKKMILQELKNISNYQDEKQSFIEEVKLNPKHSYWRVKKDLYSSYKNNATGENITVPGIIISARENVMRTDGVIVDSLLGQGEALDDYSKGLQDEKVRRQKIENDKADLEYKKELLRQQIIAQKDKQAASLFAELYAVDNVQEASNDDA